MCYIVESESYYEWYNVVLQRVTETQNIVKLTNRMWARLLASTNQPSFLNSDEGIPEKVDQEPIEVMNSVKITSV